MIRSVLRLLSWPCRRWIEKRRHRPSGKLDIHYNPLAVDTSVCGPIIPEQFDSPEPDSRILLPCSKCRELTCKNPVEHFGFTYDQFLDGTWYDSLDNQ